MKLTALIPETNLPFFKTLREEKPRVILQLNRRLLKLLKNRPKPFY